MTNGTSDVTRGEFNLLREMVSTNQQRLDSIDDHGTRGVVSLQTQMLDLVKDVGKLELAMENHEKTHKDERKERDRNRKWFISTTIAGLMLLITILALLAEVLMHLHG